MRKLKGLIGALLTHKVFYACGIIILSLTVCIAIISLQQESNFNFDYKRSAELKAALLAEVPVDSNVDDVFDFFIVNNIPHAANQTYGYGNFDDEYNVIRLKIRRRRPVDIVFGGEWIIVFLFDEDKQLKDIEITFHRVMP